MALSVTLVITGCTLGRDYARPEVPTPPAWRTPAEAGTSLSDLAWWDLFQDEALRALVRTALEESSDVRLAVARVAEARALLGVARADRFPQVDATAAYDNKRFSRASFPRFMDKIDTEQEFFKTAIDLAFEVDLWGRLRRATEAARAELLATEDARQVVVATLIADVAQTWFELGDLDEELAIARRALDARRGSARLLRRRFDEGLTPEVDVRRAEAEAAAAAAALANLDRRVAQAEHRLSVLAGKNPGPIARGRRLTAEVAPPSVPAGLPSALLERRPDIRSAEDRLVAANARIGEARTAFFPRIVLTGAFGVESVALADLFTAPARVWQFGPSVTIPLFNAGKNRARLAAAEARWDLAVAEYRATVQRAFREVEDALVAYRTSRVARESQETQVAALRRTVDLAGLRYDAGLASYLEVLDAERQLLAAELDLTRTLRDQLVTTVGLWKALGGGWQP